MGQAACEACGAEVGAAAERRDDPGVRQHAGARAEDYPELHHAFAAWRASDVSQMVLACLAHVGVSGARHVDRGPIRYWPVTTSFGAMFMVYDATRGELGIEAPLMRLPQRLAVPLMRTLLDANAYPERGRARYCLRDDLVVLRFASQLASCSPPDLIEAIGEVSTRAGRVTEPLAAAYFARPMLSELQRRGLDPAVLGAPRELSILRGPTDPPRVSAARPRSSSPAPGAYRTAPPPRTSRPAAPSPRSSLPAASPGPASVASPDAGLHSDLPIPDLPDPSAPAEVRGARSSLREETRSRLMEAERFAELLRETLSRASLDDAPLATLIQRAAIFRAALEFGDTLPAAVATLYASGRGLIDEPPRLRSRGLFGFGGGSTPVSPQLLPPLFSRLVRDLGDVPDPPRDATPPPFGSIGVLKAHLSALLEDLESGPIQPELKAFVLLGAVAETLLRTPARPERLAQLRTAYEEARGEPPLRAVARLRHLLGRLAA